LGERDRSSRSENDDKRQNTAETIGRADQLRYSIAAYASIGSGKGSDKRSYAPLTI
jgi:hypothetical protein